MKNNQRRGDIPVASSKLLSGKFQKAAGTPLLPYVSANLRQMTISVFIRVFRGQKFGLAPVFVSGRAKAFPCVSRSGEPREILRNRRRERRAGKNPKLRFSRKSEAHTMSPEMKNLPPPPFPDFRCRGARRALPAECARRRVRLDLRHVP